MGQSRTDHIIPIFVVGKHRSGTTWVTNILASHPDVFTPAHEIHKGQCESAFFSSLVRYCRWGRHEQDRLALRAIFECSDFYHLAHKEGWVSINIKDRPVEEYFRMVMDQAADLRGCSFWVEKTPAHTLLLRYLIDRYPNAKFIAVTRDFESVVQSVVYKFLNRRSPIAWMSASASTALYEKIISLHRDNILLVSYQSLISDYHVESKRICDYVGLSSQSLVSTYRANSSFPEGRRTETFWVRFLVHSVRRFVDLVPAVVCEKVVYLLLRSRQGNLSTWFFKIFHGERRD